jgi:lipopolysaccharide transport system permease protein
LDSAFAATRRAAFFQQPSRFRFSLDKNAGTGRFSASMSPSSQQNRFWGLRELATLFLRHRELIIEMTRREIADRYAGQIFGMFWSLVNPLILMGVYIFAFAYIFRMKTGGPLGYTTYLLAGSIPWLSMSEVLNKSSTVVLNHANLVKQVVFPIEILPIKAVLSVCFTQIILLFLFCIYVLVTAHFLPETFLLLPILFLFQALAMIGLCFIFSSLGAFFRDLTNILQMLTMIGFYLMPLLYLPDQISSRVEMLFYFNPFSYMTWCYQDILFYGSIRHPHAWAVFLPGSLLLFLGGFRTFRALKTMFGNVL